MYARLTIAIVSLVFLAAPARADDRMAIAKQQVQAADIHYRLGRFAVALDEYSKAYELYPVPPLLFNIGQCHKNLKNHAKAIFFFEGYLRDAPTAANRALVEDLIRESQAELDRARAVVPPPVAPEPAAPPPAALPPAAPSSRPVPSVPPSPRLDGGTSRLWPSLLIGGGVAAVTAGAVFYYYGQKRGPDQMYIYDDTRLLGGVAIALGGAAIVTGALLWLRHPAAGPVAALGPHGGYLGWAAAF